MEGYNSILKAYNRFEIEFDRGEGMYLYDTSGKKYLDFGAGIGVLALGHCDREFNEAVTKQLNTLVHVSNLFYHKPLDEASKRLCDISGMDAVFFTNSGTEANEGAIKAAKKYAYLKGRSTREIIAMEHSFHGRSIGSLSITHNPAYKEPFKPVMDGVVFAEFNNLDSVKSKITDDTCAIVLEPIQGEGGINPVDKEFLQGIRDICDEKDIVLIFDEVQCGLCRSGEYFVWQKYGVKPDILCLAKALGGGLPIGAFLLSEKLSNASLAPGDHGTTCGGSPLSCAAANASLRIMEERGLCDNVNKLTPVLESIMDDFISKYDFCIKRMGMGFMQGLKLDEKLPVGDVLKKCLNKGLVVLSCGGNTLRFLPPLVATEKHLREMESILDEVFLSCK